jgi:hypothetical protein
MAFGLRDQPDVNGFSKGDSAESVVASWSNSTAHIMIGLKVEVTVKGVAF